MVGTCGQFGLSDPDGSPCRDYMKDAGKKKDLLVEKIDKIGARVTSALKGIHDRSPQARVDPGRLPAARPGQGAPAGSCRSPRATTPTCAASSVKLNDALRTAAKKAKADFVDMVKASKGHDICAGPDAWVNGVNTDLMRALAFHPFAEEQQAVADLIMKKLDVE